VRKETSMGMDTRPEGKNDHRNAINQSSRQGAPYAFHSRDLQGMTQSWILRRSRANKR